MGPGMERSSDQREIGELSNNQGKRISVSHADQEPVTTEKAEGEDLFFSRLKEPKGMEAADYPGAVVHICDPSFGEAEAGRSLPSELPRIHMELLDVG